MVIRLQKTVSFLIRHHNFLHSGLIIYFSSLHRLNCFSRERRLVHSFANALGWCTLAWISAALMVFTIFLAAISRGLARSRVTLELQELGSEERY